MIYTLENQHLKAEISDLGATLVKFIDKKSNKDLVLGFDSEEDYLKYSGTNIGASVGRNCNRIGKAQFVLNDKLYKLSINDNENQLHGGGVNGFAFKTWKLVSFKENELVLSYFSKDLEEGFPGNLNVIVRYELEDNNLIWTYEGQADEDTILNMTNHSYFNLGEENILDLKLRITTDKYSPTDDKSLTLDEVRPVNNTVFDFVDSKPLRTNLEKTECGIDHNYVWENFEDKLMAELESEDISLSVYSDLPDMHLYTSYYLNGEVGKYGKVYKKYDGVCLECQYYPNGINYNKYLKPILKKGEKMIHYIKYRVVSK